MNAFTRKLPVVLFLLLFLGAFSPLAARAADEKDALSFAEPADGLSPASPSSEETPPAPDGSGSNEPSANETLINEPPADEPPVYEPLTSELSANKPAAPPDGAVACGTAEELLRLINEEGAERILLTADLTFETGGTDYRDFTLAPNRPTTVMMDGHVLSIASSVNLDVDGPLRFEGDGRGRPLVTVENDGVLRGEQVKIAAFGEGASALCVKPDGHWQADWMEVSAEGPGAVAVRIQSGELSELSYTSVLARGESAVGVYADGPLQFNCSSLVSDGGEAVVCGGELLLDACRAEPLPEGARVVRRHAVPPDRIEQIGYSVTVGTSWKKVEEDFGLRADLPHTVFFALYDPENEIYTTSIPVQVRYDGIPVDCSAAGRHTITARPVLVPDWLPIEIPSYAIPFHVVEPGVPWIDNIYLINDNNLQVVFLTPISGAERMLLEYSLDGRTWRDAGNLPAFEISKTGAYLEGLETDRYYYFRLTVTGGPMDGVSNVLEFPLTTGDPSQIGGGDRDDDDRGEQGSLPPESVVPAPDRDRASSATRPQRAVSTSSAEVSPPPEPQSPTEPPPAPAAPTAAPPAGATLSFTASELAAQLEANLQGVTLIGEGIRATLPAKLLDAFPPDEPLHAQLETPAADRFIARFWSGEGEIERFDAPILIDLAYEPADPSAQVACEKLESADDPIPARAYGPGRWRFELRVAGAYHILELPAPEVSAAPTPVPDAAEAVAPPPAGDAAPVEGGNRMALPAALLTAGLAAGALLLLIRKGGKPHG